MANTVEVQTINDGPKNLVIHLHIDGDGTGDLSNVNIIDISALNVPCAKLRLVRLQAEFIGVSAELKWDATTPIHFMVIPDYDVNMDLEYCGGIPNNAGVGVTGDVLISTTGLGAGDTGHAVMHFYKHY
jgi:hypothetical protein